MCFKIFNSPKYNQVKRTDTGHFIIKIILKGNFMAAISKPTLLILHFYKDFLNNQILSSTVSYCEEQMQITQETEAQATQKQHRHNI